MDTPSAIAEPVAEPISVAVEPISAAPIAVAPVAESPPVSTPVATPVAESSTPDWATLRTEYAKGDEKLLARLSRYPSQQAALDALIQAQNRISAGGLKAALSEKPTPEELKAWRADHGVPEAPTGYDIKLPNGVELDDEGKATVDGFVDMAHKNNMKPDQVNAALAYIISQRESQDAAQEQQDAEYYDNAQARLRAEMGSELPLNINLINSVLDAAPEGLKDSLLQARLPDGSLFGNNPEAIRWLAGLAREINPVATVVPGSGLGAQATIETELNSIKAMMGDDDSKYWKGPESKALQERFRKLVDVHSKIR